MSHATLTERLQKTAALPFKLGKGAPRLDPRTLRLGKYLRNVDIVPPAGEVSWVTRVPSTAWGMMLNDSLGDCVSAAMGHMVKQWTTYASTDATPTDADVLKVYEDVGGYRPGDPSTDNGMVILDALNYWRTTGIGGHKIVAYVAVNIKDAGEVRSAIELFGNVFLGIQLPISAQGETAWTVPNGGAYNDGSPGSWGGHAIPIMAASAHSLTVITWGASLKMSWNFLKDYADEAYVVLSQDWIEKTGLSPSQFDLASLQADLAQL